MTQSVAEYEAHWIEAYFYVMFYMTFHMQHICLDEIGKPASPASPDLGAAQGSMDQSVHSSAKVLLRRCFSAVSIQKWNHPNVVVVLDCLHCLLSIQWFFSWLRENIKVPSCRMFEVKADLMAVHYSLGHALSAWTCYAAGLRGVLRKDTLESSSVHANTHASTQDHERVQLFPVQSRANLFGVLSCPIHGLQVEVWYMNVWYVWLWMINNDHIIISWIFMVSSAVWLMSGEVKIGPEGWIMMLGTCLAHAWLNGRWDWHQSVDSTSQLQILNSLLGKEWVPLWVLFESIASDPIFSQYLVMFVRLCLV